MEIIMLKKGKIIGDWMGVSWDKVASLKWMVYYYNAWKSEINRWLNGCQLRQSGIVTMDIIMLKKAKSIGGWMGVSWDKEVALLRCRF